jgi:hypothetical protein
MDFGMIETNITLRKLTADEGKVLTNGEAYGKEIYLGIYDSPENWHEITDAEYAQILAAQEKEEGAMQ